jgi:DNA-binding NarL/FixJ family response regulator
MTHLEAGRLHGLTAPAFVPRPATFALRPPHQALPLASMSAALYKTPSQRELEMAPLMVDRYSDKEIAEKLTMAPGTVHTHMTRMREKSGLHDRRALGKWALAQARMEGVYTDVADSGPLDAPVG